MRVHEALVALLTRDINIKKADEIARLIEDMKCCGNCKYFSSGNCFEPVGSSICDNWKIDDFEE